MNYCTEYETRILEYEALPMVERSAIDGHLAGCEGCRRFSTALAEVDFALSSAITVHDLSSVAVARVLRMTMSPPARPPIWPLVLDLAGWASVLAALLIVAIVSAPQGMQETASWFALGAATVVGSAYFGFKSWREIGS